MNHLTLTLGQLRDSLAHRLTHIAPRILSRHFGQSLSKLLALATQAIEAGVTYRRHCHRVRTSMLLQRLVSAPQTLFDIGYRVLRLDLHTEQRAGETIHTIVERGDKYVEFVWGHFEFLSVSNTFGRTKVQQRCVNFPRKFRGRKLLSTFVENFRLTQK